MGETAVSAELDTTKGREHRRLTIAWVIALIAVLALVFAARNVLFASVACATFLTIWFVPIGSWWQRVEFALTAGWLAGVCVALWSPHLLIEALLLYPLGALLAISWLARTLFEFSTLCSKRAVIWWLSVPALGLLGVLLVVTDLCFPARVLVCERLLLDAAEEEARNPSLRGNNRVRLVGLFWVSEIDRAGASVAWTTRLGLLWHKVGVAYCPEGQTADLDFYELTHLYGDWYKFSWND
jgi:hypothetical protein